MTTLNVRETTRGELGMDTRDIFDSVFGCSLVFCLGDYLPYNIIKKYEEEEGFSLIVNTRAIYDDKINITVWIDDKEVYNHIIFKHEYNVILSNLDILRNDINDANYDEIMEEEERQNEIRERDEEE